MTTHPHLQRIGSAAGSRRSAESEPEPEPDGGRDREADLLDVGAPAWLDDFSNASDQDFARSQNRWDDDDDDDGYQRPSGLRGALSDRLASTPRTAIALVVLALAAAVIAVVATLRGGGSDYPVVDFTASPASSAPPPIAAPSSSGAVAAAPTRVVVAVVGLVRRPGLVTLAADARVSDALLAAGGALPGADTISLNLARPLADGEQVIVGLREPNSGNSMRSVVLPSAAVSGSGAAPIPGVSSTPAGAPVNVNTASAADLDALPGVGPVIAAAIISYRETHGPFTTVDGIGEVTGIGPAKLAKLRPLLTV